MYQSSDSAAIIGLLVWILVLATFIAQAKIFIKAGEKWWKLLIPIYGQYIQYKVAGCKKLFWIMLGSAVVYGVISALIIPSPDAYGYYSRSAVESYTQTSSALMLVYGIFTLVLGIMYCVKLAKAFGKGGGFAAGLLLLPPVFIMILGFGSAQYVGAPGYLAPSRKGWNCSCGHINDPEALYCQRCGSRMP
ncbi:MAG: zinc ribbon domain-containing protein [Clostridia bacterium]|nr:zinc ribbon domain-containing protein [Clostridia bacterium]